MDDTPRVTVPVEPEYTYYRRSQIAHLRPYVAGETLSDRVSISAADLEAGSPKPGDVIARNPANHDDQWLVAADYFAANFEPVSAAPAPEGGAVSEGELRDAITLILPMAKGYAAANPVGSNQAYVDYVENLIATREEAPAEAGELASQIAILRKAANSPTPDEDAGLTPESALKSAQAWRTIASNVVEAFDRAQPQAREDAQPVADEVLPVAWVIRTKDGHIRMWTMSEKRARAAAALWGMEARQEGLSPQAHPAPDALRGAVEALRPLVVAMEDFLNEPQRRPVSEPIEVRDYRHDAYRVWTPLCQALVAMQAEQKGGAA